MLSNVSAPRAAVSSGSVEVVGPCGQEGKAPVVQWCDFAAPIRVLREACGGGLLFSVALLCSGQPSLLEARPGYLSSPCTLLMFLPHVASCQTFTPVISLPSSQSLPQIAKPIPSLAQDAQMHVSCFPPYLLACA